MSKQDERFPCLLAACDLGMARGICKWSTSIKNEDFIRQTCYLGELPSDLFS